MSNLNPFKKGDVVRVRKGSVIRFKGAKRIAKKDYKVTVDHTFDPEHIRVGTYVHYETGSQFHFNGCSDHDLHIICAKLGVPYTPYNLKTPELDAVRELAMQDMEDPYGHGTSWNCYVTIAPAKVVWPGSGGYWMEASINDVEKVEG